ncbi:MAG: 6,7-dimethyl-8-ribityllumazine synthase [Bacteroidetes bacterium]|jgi:6,7-dimethyl-8-ribityllumazine synthase|nr:6,7-dimethyl-8-ribityllumazine synthase [Bacteroidota bacterium]
MATVLKNLSDYNADSIKSGKGQRIAIIVAEWNSEVTFALRDGAISSLKKHGVSESDIEIHNVPGAFELTLGAEWAGTDENIDAVICIGCVIKGETPHFDFICQGVTYGITELNISLSKPVIFAVLTTNTLAQAIDRSGGVHGNKGDEAAITALKMLELRDKMNK